MRLEPYLRPLVFAFMRLTRGKTLGVRALVRDGEGRVLLVRHTYVPGWWLPGGGVERGQTAAEAVARELAEEAGVRLSAPPALVSIHSNDRRFRGDHVLLYRIEADGWAPCTPTAVEEIAEIGWFDSAALPPDVNRGSRARIAEVLNGLPADAHW